MDPARIRLQTRCQVPVVDTAIKADGDFEDAPVKIQLDVELVGLNLEFLDGFVEST